jgi:membrane protein implicated in regulation of membrane protease activity
MKPISLGVFLVVMLLLGVSLLWFPNLVSLLTNLMPVGTPTWLKDFLAFLPYGTLSIMLIAYVIKLSKRGKRDDFHEE